MGKKKKKEPKPFKYKLTIVWGVILLALGIVAIYYSNRYRNRYAFECETFLVDEKAGIYHLDWDIMSCAQNDCIEKPAPLKGKSEIILDRKGYTVSYNKDNKIPNWVAWHLTSEHIEGKYKRTGGYQEDSEVPEPRATKEDYDNTRWSHGHMCPAFC